MRPLHLAVLPTSISLALSLTLGVSPVAAQSPTPMRQIPPPGTDSLVVAVLSRGDQEEVALATAALPALRNPEVHRFAQMTLDEHTAHLAATTAIAERLRVPVAPNMTPMTGTAPTTDSSYIGDLVSRHRALLSQLPPDTTAVSDAGVKKLLTDSRQALQRHLEAALKVQRGMGVANR